MLLVQYLTVKGLAAGLFRPVAETESCSYQGHNFHLVAERLRGVLLSVLAPPTPTRQGWSLSPYADRALGYRDMPWTTEQEEAPACRRVRSLDWDTKKASRLPSKPGHIQVGCDQVGVPWLPELERSSITLPG
jgi:hypothetical protein